MNSLLDQEAYTYELEIYGKKYSIDVTWLLHLKTGIVSDLSGIELEESLEKIAGYIHTFNTAYEEAKQIQLTEELQYDIWYKSKYEEAEKSLCAKFSNDVSIGIRSKTYSVPSGKQIETELVNRNVEEYKKKTDYMNKVKHYADCLYHEMKIIETRGSHLQSILSNRRTANNLGR